MRFSFRVLIGLTAVSVLSGGAILGYSAMATLEGEYNSDWTTLLIDSGHYEEAQSQLERRLKAKPWDANAAMLLGRCLAAQGKLRDAAQALGQVPDTAPIKPEALLREGQTYLQAFDAVNAERAWRQCVAHPTATRPILLHAWKELSDLCAAEDRQEELTQCLWALHELAAEDSKAAVLQQLLSQELLRVEPLVRAKRLRQFIEGNPEDFRAQVALARCYVEANQFEQGQAALERCLQADPQNVDAWRGWLWCLYQQGDTKSLTQHIDSAPEGLKEESGYWKLHAVVAQEKRQWRVAADSLKKALELSPNEVDLHSQYAVVLARLGETELAQKHGAVARALRDAQRDMTTAYEDWATAIRDHAPEYVLMPIVARLQDSCERAGLIAQAQAWGKLRKELN